MPLFMDIHDIADGVAIDDVAKAHLANALPPMDHAPHAGR
jgi:hypothetical protein